MKTARVLVILLVSILMITGASQSLLASAPPTGSGAAPATEPGANSVFSGTRTASCVVKVSCDLAILPVIPETIKTLLRSSTVGGKAAREVLGVPMTDSFFEFLSLSSFGNDLLFQLKVQLPDDVKPAAEEFMNAVISNLRQAIFRAFESYRSRLTNPIQQAQERCNDEQRNLSEALGLTPTASRKEIEKHRQELLRVNGIDMPVEVLLKDKSQLLQSKRSAEMDVARLEARRSAIVQQIEEISKQADSKVKDDPISAELRLIIERQMQALQRVKTEGIPQKYSIAPEEDKLSRTKIELAKRQEELSKSIVGDQLQRFNNELADSVVTLAEKHAELDVLGQQLGQIEKQLTMVSASEPLVSRIHTATRALEEAEQRLNQLKNRQAELQVPVVAIIGAE